MKLEFIEAGEIVSTHGIRGEMKVLPWSDGPDFLTVFSRVMIDGRCYEVDSCRVQKNCDLLKLRGVDSVEAAQLLRGKTVEIYRDDVSDEVIFAAELIDMVVVCDGTVLGKIVDVLDYPGNKVYVVEGEHSYMIHAVKEFVLSTDMDANEMCVKIIEGMRVDEG